MCHNGNVGCLADLKFPNKPKIWGDSLKSFSESLRANLSESVRGLELEGDFEREPYRYRASPGYLVSLYKVG